MYAFNAGAGLMVIGKLAKVVSVQASYEGGFFLVALLAVGNAVGRVLAGTVSDKLGRIRTLQIFTVFQAAMMFLTPSVYSPMLWPASCHEVVVERRKVPALHRPMRSRENYSYDFFQG